eukprot:7541532-Pyramimonas_sp.AAC.1
MRGEGIYLLRVDQSDGGRGYMPTWQRGRRARARSRTQARCLCASRPRTCRGSTSLTPCTPVAGQTQTRVGSGGHSGPPTFGPDGGAPRGLRAARSRR